MWHETDMVDAVAIYPLSRQTDLAGTRLYSENDHF